MAAESCLRLVRSLIFTALALFFALQSAPAVAGEMKASGISVPFFNAAGKLSHRLLAKSGTLSDGVHSLQGVALHYFSPDDPTVIVQKLETAEATWDDRKETLAGQGSLVVATVEHRITGEGFDFALATSLLHIHRQFTMTNDEALLTSDRATIELIVERGTGVKVRDVKRCEAIGNLHVVIQPAAQSRYRFKEAFSDLAIYDGVTRNVVLPNQTRTLQVSGGEARFNRMEFLLGDQAKKSPP